MAAAKILAAACFIAGVAVPSLADVFYTRDVVPAGWSKGAAAPAHAKVEFTLALRQRNLDILDKWFWEVSEPTHRNYQDYKSIDELRDLTSPTDSELAKVWEWLHSAGIHHPSTTHFGDSLDVVTSVKHAEKLFNTKMHVYTHKETGAKIVRQWGDYGMPDEIAPFVDIVTGLSTFPIPHLTVRRPNAANDYGVVPQTIDALYQISKESRAALAATGIKTSQGVIEFQGQSFSPDDLANFATGTNIKIAPLNASTIIGPNDPSGPQVEATLDIQMVAAVNTEATNWFWLEQGQGWLYQFVQHFAATKDVPQVSSISYGWWEGDQCTITQECQTLGINSQEYTERVNTELKKIALRGVSILASSGDSGANGRTDSDCSVQHLRAAFPSSSPYITSVGATELTKTSPLSNPPPICASAGLDCVETGYEQAVSFAISNFASGGGFSDIAPQPDYQKAAVTKYLKSNVKLPSLGYFNASGRGAPDVAAIGHNLIINDGGQVQPVGGTSASSPIFASVIALLNVASIEKTGKPLGFLNPFLYKMAADEPSTFHDVTEGDNKCTESGCGASCQGYEAYAGWDPVTGLGTPNFEKMLAYVKAGRHLKAE